MLTWLLLLTLVCLPSAALAVESLTFGALMGWFGGGAIGYDGAGGPLVASGPEFNSVQLHFTTGPNLEDGPLPSKFVADPPDQTFRWNDGGRFEFSIPFYDGDYHPLEPQVFLAGSLHGASLTVQPIDPSTHTWVTDGFYLDLVIDYIRPESTIDPDTWLGLPATMHLTVNYPAYIDQLPDGAFYASPSAAIITLVPTPEPGTWLLMGSGLAAVGFVGRVRCRCCRGPVGIPRPSGLCAICRTPSGISNVCFCGKIHGGGV